MSRILTVPRALAAWGVLFLLLAVPSLPAQEAGGDSGPKLSFGMSAALGTETLNENNKAVMYQSFGLLPDIGYGPLGVGIDLSFHFRFYEHSGGDFGFYPRSADWWDSSLTTAQNLDKYLSRILYVRWGHKGDPLYVQAGLLPSTTLGTGFVVGGYDNGALRPDLKYIGLEFDATGELIGLPYGGFESFVGNLSTFDVLGARIYAKPFGLILPDNGFLKPMQFGLTVAADTNPFAQNPNSTNKVSGSVFATGLDVMLPLYSSDLVSAVASVDAATQDGHSGASLGVGGKAFSLLTWGIQPVRFLGDNFIADYFDRGYEVNRSAKFQIYNSKTTVIPSTIGWQASLGASILGDALTFGAVVSGPWSEQTQLYALPQLQSYAALKPGLLPIDVNAFYVKNGLKTLGDLLTAENALIGAKVGYTIGVVTLSVVYDLRYLTDTETAAAGNGNHWTSSSRIETAVKMF